MAIMKHAEKKAGTLIEALPYIQEFYGKTIVVKYGGNAMINEDLKHKVMEDISLLKYVGIRPVIVHGGGPDITHFLKKVGKQSDFVSGLRVTGNCGDCRDGAGWQGQLRYCQHAELPRCQGGRSQWQGCRAYQGKKENGYCL